MQWQLHRCSSASGAAAPQAQQLLRPHARRPCLLGLQVLTTAALLQGPLQDDQLHKVTDATLPCAQIETSK